MHFKQEKDSASTLASKPSTAFSTGSAASATSKGTSRSGTSKLLFGEIDTSSERSNSCAYARDFILCGSSSFLTFWLDDKCRDLFLSYVHRSDLSSLRATCQVFATELAPSLFTHLDVTFNSNTFTSKSRREALRRVVGVHVQTLKLTFPHSDSTFLPPLVHPQTGEAIHFRYEPQLEESTRKDRKYGDETISRILVAQWPPLWHAATNVLAFVDAFKHLVNLSHLTISCPGYDAAQRYRPSIVDYALTSLRIAVEQNNLDMLTSLTLSPIHPGGLFYLNPLSGHGAQPDSPQKWARITHLDVQVESATLASCGPGEAVMPSHFSILQTYLRHFQSNLTHLRFAWNGKKTALPIRRNAKLPARPSMGESTHPALRDDGPTPLIFPRLEHVDFANGFVSASDMRAFAAEHKQIYLKRSYSLELKDANVTDGVFDVAVAAWIKNTVLYYDFLRTPTADAHIPASAAAADATESTHTSSTGHVSLSEIPIMLSPEHYRAPAKQKRPPQPRKEARYIDEPFTSSPESYYPRIHTMSRHAQAAHPGGSNKPSSDVCHDWKEQHAEAAPLDELFTLSSDVYCARKHPAAQRGGAAHFDKHAVPSPDTCRTVTHPATRQVEGPCSDEPNGPPPDFHRVLAEEVKAVQLEGPIELWPSTYRVPQKRSLDRARTEQPMALAQDVEHRAEQYATTQQKGAVPDITLPDIQRLQRDQQQQQKKKKGAEHLVEPFVLSASAVHTPSNARPAPNTPLAPNVDPTIQGAACPALEEKQLPATPPIQRWGSLRRARRQEHARPAYHDDRRSMREPEDGGIASPERQQSLRHRNCREGVETVPFAEGKDTQRIEQMDHKDRGIRRNEQADTAASERKESTRRREQVYRHGWTREPYRIPSKPIQATFVDADNGTRPSRWPTITVMSRERKIAVRKVKDGLLCAVDGCRNFLATFDECSKER